MSELNFTKSQFQGFVQQVTLKATPKPGDEKNYIGLEHLRENRLHLTYWGGDIELKGQKYSIKQGDILFAKRNAYLKRVSVSPVDGIFSAHGMVFRPTGNALKHKFLKYFLLSSSFWKRAISISEGSLSPTIKWSTLARQTFRVPKLEAQENILPILDGLTIQEAKIYDALSSLEQSLRLFQKTVFGNYFDILKHKRTALPKGWVSTTIKEILEEAPVSGNSINVVDRDTGHYVLNLNCLSKDGFFANGYKTIEPSQFPSALQLRNGDLLISRSNTVDLVGLVGIYEDTLNRKAIFPDTMWRLHVNEELIGKEFLMNYLLSPYARREVQRIAAGSSGSMKKINKTGFGKMLTPIPPKNEQENINKVLNGYRKTREALLQKLDRTCVLRLRLIDEILGD